MAAHSAQIMKENGSPAVGKDWVGLNAGLRVWMLPFFWLLPVLKRSAQLLWSLAYGVVDVRDKGAATGEHVFIHLSPEKDHKTINHGISVAFLHKCLFLLTGHWVVWAGLLL